MIPAQSAPKTIRNCPLCRIAMVGSRTNPSSVDFDTFHCLRCDTVIRLDMHGPDHGRHED